MWDIVIENARILDGRGNPWYRGSVAVAGGRIAAIGRRLDGQARERLDARGLFISPGFIDAHTHSDYCYLMDPTAQSKVRQGITTEVTGNCGMSAAPLLGAARRSGLVHSLAPDWTSMGEYLDALGRSALPVNLAPLVGHGTLRSAAIGLENRPGTPDELAALERMLFEALDAGVVGMSTGLYFAPGMYAPRDELTRLFRTVGERGGIVANHIRDEGTYTVGFLAAVEEIISLGREASCPVHFSHIKAHGPEVWGTSQRVLEMIEAARAEGVQVSCDQYPYEASGGGIAADSLPHAFQAGRSPEQMAHDLSRPEVRAELHDIVAANIVRRGGPERLFISSYPAEDVLGKSVQQLAEEQRTTPAQVVMALLAEGEGARAGWTCFSMHPDDVARAGWTCFSMHPDDVARFMRYPGTMIGSDGSGLSTEGPLSGGNPHPRNYGTFPRVLGHYVRDEGLLTLEDAVRKMTSLPAQTFGLHDRGSLQPGAWADLVIFDLERVTDAPFERPKTYPQGIPYVMVNGQWVIHRGEFTGALPGQVLRRD